MEGVRTLYISCCSLYKECSDKAECLRLDNELYDELYKHCSYARKLKKGINFFTEYNVNNQARAEEYKRKQNNNTEQISKEDIVDGSRDDKEHKNYEVTDIYNDKVSVHPPDKPKGSQSTKDIPDQKDKYKNAYLVVDGRQFYIGKRGGYGGYTYSLGREGIDELKTNIGDLSIEFDTEYIESKFVDECGTNSDRADWKPYVKIGNSEYNIMNSNIRALKESTSRTLAEYFAELGLKTACECKVNNKRSFTHSKTSQPKKPQNNKSQKVDVANNVVEEDNVQISMFDF